MSETLAAARPGTATRHYSAVDAYRAVAAIAIVVFHVAFLSGVNIRRPWIGVLLARLDVGVPLFFVLSGFLLYRPFVAAHLAGRPAPDLRRFLTRRLLRIVPAYWVTLAVVAFVLHQSRIGGMGDAIIYFGFLQIYSKSHLNGGISQAWSLCTEMTFYLALPVWAWAVRRAARRRTGAGVRTEAAGVVALYAFGIAVRAAIAYRGPHRPFDVRLDWLPATTDLFALGMALAVATAWCEQRGRTPAPLAALASRPWWCWLAAAAAYLVVATVVFGRGDLGHVIRADQIVGREVLYGIVAVLIVLPGVVGAERPARPGWAGPARVLRALGLISYGIYLTHNAVLDRAFTSGPRTPFATAFWPLLGVTLGGAVLAGAALHVAVERPALRWKGRMRG